MTIKEHMRELCLDEIGEGLGVIGGIGFNPYILHTYFPNHQFFIFLPLCPFFNLFVAISNPDSFFFRRSFHVKGALMERC